MSSSAGSAKKQWKAIDLETKMKIINNYEGGKTVKDIADAVEMAHSTISTILKTKDSVKEAVKASTSFNAIITRQQEGLIHKTEKLLAIWFDDQIPKRMPFDHPSKSKKGSIFAMFTEQREESTDTFYDKSWMLLLLN